MIVVRKILEEGGACPYQLTAETNQGELYARYRGGRLTVEVNNELVFSKFVAEDQDDEETIATYRTMNLPEDFIARSAETFKKLREIYPDRPLSFDGSMTLEELKELTKDIIQWP